MVANSNNYNAQPNTGATGGANDVPLPPSYDYAVSEQATGSVGQRSPPSTSQALPESPQMRNRSPYPADESKGHRALQQQIPPSTQAIPYIPNNQPQPRSSSPFVYQPQPQPQPQPLLSPPSSLVYHYQNPRTGQTISSLFPPDHPEMVCLQEGQHKTGRTQWGIVGILSAVLFFPLGVAVCLVDREVRCRRCGYMIHRGIST